MKIVDREWPLIAHGSFDCRDDIPGRRSQPTVTIDIQVRQHADGRVIVYSLYSYGQQNHAVAPIETHHAGHLLEAGDDIPAAINSVSEELLDQIINQTMYRHVITAARETIANLPRAPRQIRHYLS